MEYIEEKNLVEKLKSLLGYQIDNYQHTKSKIAEKLSMLYPPTPSNIAWRITSVIFNVSIRSLKEITSHLKKLLKIIPLKGNQR